ncbi:MAG TPA: hypothetical protein VGI39_41125 [Polyangiaceae bacterium]
MAPELALYRNSVATVQTSPSTIDTSPGVDEARIGNTGKVRGLVIEEARTNVYVNSRNPGVTFRSANGWNTVVTGTTVTPAYAASPDGSSNGTRVQIPVLGGNSGVSQFFTGKVVSPGEVLTFSEWLRSTLGSYDAGAGATPPILQWGSCDNAYRSEWSVATPTTTDWARSILPSQAAAPSGATMSLAPAFQSWGWCGDLGVGVNSNLYSVDQVVDLIQAEPGYFATEPIITGSAMASRAGDHLEIPNGPTAIDGGQLSLYLQMYPKGDALACPTVFTNSGKTVPMCAPGYTSPAYLFYIDPNNYAFFDARTQSVQLAVGGSVLTSPPAAVSDAGLPIQGLFSAGQSVEWFIRAGVGAALVQLRVNGAVTTLIDGTLSGAVAAGPIDLLSRGTSNQFSAWLANVAIYPQGDGRLTPTVPVSGTVPPGGVPTGRLPACWAPSFTATAAQYPDGGTYYTSIQYAPVEPNAGVCAPLFCDSNGTPVPAPTPEQLNSAPPPGSTCSPITSSASCTVDPSTLTTPCSTDADCAAGGICASHCVDTGCTQIEHRCGMPSASCAALPAAANCVEYTMCPYPGFAGTPNGPGLSASLPPTSTADPSGQISPTDKDAPPTAYPSVASTLCGDMTLATPVTLTDTSSKPAQDGSQQWGVYLTPISSFNVNPLKRTDDVAEITLKAGGGIAAGGIVFGNKIEVISAEIDAQGTDCGFSFTGAVKIFGEAVVTWTPSSGQNFHLITDPSGQGLSTDPNAVNSCKGARDNEKGAIQSARTANISARAVLDYYNNHGLTPELCQSVENQLPNSPMIKDSSGDVYDCNNLPSLSHHPVNLINAWQQEYKNHTADWLNFASALGTAHGNVTQNGTIPVYNQNHPFKIAAAETQIPIGPFDLTLAVEAYGFWDIAGGIQYGLGYSGASSAIDMLKQDLAQLPQDGDLRLYAGPVITPAVGVGVLAYVGFGIAGLTVGIQGQVDLLDVELKAGVVAAAVRTNKPDPRALAGTEWDGTPIVQPADYRWVTGYDWGVNLDLGELKGELDLAARVDLFLWSHTWKLKLFSWPGLKQEFVLVGGAGGDPLAFADDYGTQADNVAYTTINPVTEPITFNTNGPPGPSCGIGR